MASFRDRISKAVHKTHRKLASKHGRVSVKGYVRSDGKKVKGYVRKKGK